MSKIKSRLHRVNNFLINAGAFNKNDILIFYNNPEKKFQIVNIKKYTTNKGIFGLENTNVYYVLKNLENEKIDSDKNAKWNTEGRLFSSLKYLIRDNKQIYSCFE